MRGSEHAKSACDFALRDETRNNTGRQRSWCRIVGNRSVEVAMSASSGAKRRRRREKKRETKFLHFYETVSLRAAIAGVAGSVALLVWVAIRAVTTTPV